MRPDVTIGGFWVCTNRKHRGLRVEVVGVNTRCVRVRPLGAWSRSQRNKFWTVPIDIFLMTNRPIGER